MPYSDWSTAQLGLPIVEEKRTPIESDISSQLVYCRCPDYAEHPILLPPPWIPVASSTHSYKVFSELNFIHM